MNRPGKLWLNWGPLRSPIRRSRCPLLPPECGNYFGFRVQGISEIWDFGALDLGLPSWPYTESTDARQMLDDQKGVWTSEFGDSNPRRALLCLRMLLRQIKHAMNPEPRPYILNPKPPKTSSTIDPQTPRRPSRSMTMITYQDDHDHQDHHEETTKRLLG